MQLSHKIDFHLKDDLLIEIEFLYNGQDMSIIQKILNITESNFFDNINFLKQNAIGIEFIHHQFDYIIDLDEDFNWKWLFKNAYQTITLSLDNLNEVRTLPPNAFLSHLTHFNDDIEYQYWCNYLQEKVGYLMNECHIGFNNQKNINFNKFNDFKQRLFEQFNSDNVQLEVHFEHLNNMKYIVVRQYVNDYKYFYQNIENWVQQYF